MHYIPRTDFILRAHPSLSNTHKLFIFGCTGSLPLHAVFLWLQTAGTTLQLRCAGFPLHGLFLLQSAGSRT